MTQTDVNARRGSLWRDLALIWICVTLLQGCIIDDEAALMSDREEVSSDVMSDETASDEQIEMSHDEGELVDCSEGGDLNLVVSEIIAVSPNEVSPGEVVDLKIFGEGIDCNASLLIYGDGLEMVTEPQVYQDSSNRLLRFIKLRLKVNEDASLGLCRVVILNPNGSVASAPDLFEIVPQ